MARYLYYNEPYENYVYIDRILKLQLKSSLEHYLNLPFMMLTLSPPILLRFYILAYWSNPPYLISDIWALCQKIKNKNGGLHNYGAEPFKKEQFETTGVEGRSPNS